MASPGDTEKLAQSIAPLLAPGDSLLLAGEIGAGKTHFARALIQARLATAGLVEDVPSPTFTLVQTYDDTITEIWHADLYRLTDSSEMIELGLEDALSDAICLVEWPEKLVHPNRQDALHIRFEQGVDPDARILTFTGENNRWSKLSNV